MKYRKLDISIPFIPHKTEANKGEGFITGVIGAPSMASDALSELVNCNCCHYFPAPVERRKKKISGINDGSKL